MRAGYNHAGHASQNVLSMTDVNLVPLVFTDLDGTLLNHHDYSFEPARPAIDSLIEQRIPIIFNTSKTQAESIKLARRIGINHPLVIENGGALVIPENYDFAEPFKNTHSWLGQAQVIPLGTSLDVIKDALRAADSPLDVATHYEGFSTMTVADICDLTGLSPDEAKDAKSRGFSEPLRWFGDAKKLPEFENFLNRHGLKLTLGGRFHHVMGNTDKCTAMVRLAKMYEDCAVNTGKAFIIALGDSENDSAMLSGADIAVVVSNRAGSGLEIAHPNLIRTTREGPHGWQEAIEQILPSL